MGLVIVRKDILMVLQNVGLLRSLVVVREMIIHRIAVHVTGMELMLEAVRMNLHAPTIRMQVIMMVPAAFIPQVSVMLMAMERQITMMVFNVQWREEHG
jgi:hypothetical protein